MKENAPEQPELSSELSPIEFASPGRFAIHNPAPEQVPATDRQAAAHVLGEEQTTQRFSKASELHPHALALLQQAQHSLCIYTPDLEPWLYHHSSIQDACCQFLLARPQNRLRILLRDSGRAVREGHRLLTLARRLSSNFHIRKLNPDYPNEDSAFLLADQHGLLLRPESDQYAGYALYNDPGRTRQLQRQFDQAWDTSQLDPDLRSFLL